MKIFSLVHLSGIKSKEENYYYSEERMKKLEYENLQLKKQIQQLLDTEAIRLECAKCLEKWSIKDNEYKLVKFCPFCGTELANITVRKDYNGHYVCANTTVGRDNKGNYVYVGEMDDNNIPNGKGELTYASGEKYLGTFANGRLTGKGKWILIYGKMFEGMFEDGKQVEGDGILEDTNGDIYTGYFRKGLRMHGIVNVTRKGWKKSTRIEYENGHKKRAL